MSSNLQVKLKEFAELVNQPYQPSSDENLNYIGLEHIEQQTLRLNGIGNSSDVISQKHKFKAGDILFGKLRPYFRKVVRPSFNGVCSTDIWVVRAKPGFDQSFLFYFLANQRFIDACNSSSSGTRMPRADWNHLSETLWELPSLPEQKSIAEILSALDDKIELNRQTNATLEAIAQAIFKEWFVDFNYPGATGELVESPLGPIPKGWHAGTVGDAVKRVSAGKIYNFKSSLPSGDVPILDQAHFSIIGYHNESAGVTASIEKPVIVFSNHRCYTDLIQFPFSAIQNVLPFIGNQVDTRWLYHATDGIITYSEYKGHWPEFVSKLFLIPPFTITKMYGDLVKPAQVLKMENLRESQVLAEQRDTLLPKLISGEIEI